MRTARALSPRHPKQHKCHIRYQNKKLTKIFEENHFYHYDVIIVAKDTYLRTMNTSAPHPRASSGTKKTPALPREYLAFRLGAEQYGIDILRVQEIRSYEQPTRLAHAPDFIKGVIDLRGRIVPIVDLRMKLQYAEVAYNECTVVIILDMGISTVVGAVVDSVADVVSLASGQIKPPPQFGTLECVDPAFVQGIAHMDDRMLILMDITALLNHDGIDWADTAAAA